MNKNLDVYNFINDHKINKGKDNIIVFIYADWCSHCTHTKPLFDKVSNEHNNCSFVKINYEYIPQFLEEHKIKGFPTFLWFVKSGNNYQLKYNASGADQLDIILDKVKQTQNTHEYYVPENSIVNTPSKKGYSVNGIINETLRKLTERAYNGL